MKLVDSHCHLHNVESFGGSTAEELLARAAEAGLGQIVVIGTSYEDSLKAQEFAEKYSSDELRVDYSFGVHPSELEKEYREPDFGERLKPIAIGEVGLDYHYGPEDYGGINMSFEEMRQAQFRLLEEMLELGIRQSLPFSFHVREAFNDFFAILDNFSEAEIRGVIHSFTDNKKNLAKVLDRGFYVGVNGMATYSTLPRPPMERILTETDAPYLAPVPHRHEINEPAYIRDIVKWIAEQYEMGVEETSEILAKNFAKCFAR